MKQYLLILVFTIFHTLQGSSNPTDLDTSFNNPNGYTELNIGSYIAANQNRVLLQDDEKIISIGTTSDTSETGYTALVLARYLTDGSLDITYGTSGLTYASFGHNTYAYAAAIQTDGKVVVTGSLNTSSPASFFIARFTTDGILDTTFNAGGTPGYVINSFSGTSSNPTTAIAIDATSGNIFVSGYSLLNPSNYRQLFAYSYTSIGTLNTDFNSPNGYVTAPIPPGYYQATSGSQMIIQPDDNKVVIVGAISQTNSTSNVEWQAYIIRYLSNGTLDTTSFASPNAYIIFDDTTPSFLQGVALQANGNIVVSGYQDIESNHQIMTARYLTNGTLDTSFANGAGYLTTTIPSASSIGISTMIETSGRIIAGGYATFSGSINNILLVRYNPNGTLDTSISPDGYMLSSIEDESTRLNGNAIQSDGKLVVVAQFNNGTNQIMTTIRYLGGNILEPTTTEIGKYGTNSALFQEFSYVNFYAQIITNTTAKSEAISDVNNLLEQYAADYIDQPNFNFLLYLYLLEEQLTDIKTNLILEYGDVGISQFFNYLNKRFTRLSTAQ